MRALAETRMLTRWGAALLQRIVLARARLLALPATSPVAQVVAGTRVTTGATWLDHAMAVTRSLGITVDFPVEDMLPTARACADTRRKAVKQWKRTFVVPAVRAHEQRWFVLQLAALNNEGVVPYRDLLPVREPLTPGIRWAP